VRNGDRLYVKVNKTDINDSSEVGISGNIIWVHVITLK
jgi:hypothetical protein